ncbi:MAG: TolC family protein [Gemmatimonadetes bacterium]|nr:TolC family protein [Gemmatimonadota bacterium]
MADRRRRTCPERRSGATLALALTGLVLSAGSARAQTRALPDTLDLDTALRIALERSPQIATARAQAGAAGADRRAAWGAFLPTAAADLSLARSDFTRTTFEGEEGISETLPEPLTSGNQNASQGFRLSWTLFDQGRRFTTLSQEGSNVRAAQRQLDDRRAAVVAATGRAFYDALRSQRLLDLGRRQIADRELELDIAQRRYAIAAVERIDVLAAESNLLDARVGLLRNQRQTDAALRTLAVELGLDPDDGLGTSLRDVATLPAGEADATALVERALASDPELLQLDAQRAAASAALMGARAGYLPRITANISWGRSQTFGLGESFFQFDPQDNSRQFSISASWNIFDGFAREQQTARASAQRRQAEEDLRRRRLEIERDVRGFAAEIGQLSETLAIAERSFEIAQERLDMSRQMYRNGTIDFTALQQAISGVTSAEQQLINIRYDYLTAWVNLREFGGTGG